MSNSTTGISMERLRLILRILLVTLILLAAGIGALYQPSWWYQHHTVLGPLRVYHDSMLPEGFSRILEQSLDLVRSSPLFEQNQTIYLCIGASNLPARLMRLLQPQAVAVTSFNRIIIPGHLDAGSDQIRHSGALVSFPVVLAHEMIHVFQQHHFGIGFIRQPAWKKEGYPEYIARKYSTYSLPDLYQMYRQCSGSANGEHSWLVLDDQTGIHREYLEAWLMTRHLIEVEGWSYLEILADTQSREQVWKQLEKWSEKEGLQSDEIHFTD